MEIKNYKPIHKGYILGKFEIHIPEWGGLCISECLLFQKDEKKWISLPSKEYQNSNGEKKHFPLIKFTPEAFKRLQDSVFNLLTDVLKQAPQDNYHQEEVPF